MGGDAGSYAPCGCYTGPWWGVQPPPQCAEHGGPPPAMTITTAGTGCWCNACGRMHTTSACPTPQPTSWLRLGERAKVIATLDDEDIDRIAKRVVALLKGA